MTIPEQAEQAVQAAQNEFTKFGYTAANEKALIAALTAAAPHLAAVQVKKIGYVSAAELHTLQQIETCVDLFTVAQTGPMEFVPVYVLDASAADCSCTKVQQDETCPVGYPSLLCEICDGKGVVQPSADRAAVLEEAARWHEAEAARKRTVAVKSKRLDAQIATHEASAAHFRALHPVADKPSDDGAQGEGWLDINDAPQDGTVVDLWCDRLSKRVPNCRWNPDFNIGYPEDGPGFWEQLVGSEWRPSYDENWFSHYRTLPTPPSSEVA
ncbi:hypothetical protein BRY73_03020 [Ochrobactrum sp. P6BS-III]|uniref:hypothetical protein n=1 Tax=unclassified Ochrobactrum TaxID=239106 RepID=UPI0009931B7A|nr:hypothetical protein [Ochrobactrum sp. P6BSIII]OOL20147.1 hypothetical protein BRY73_03020 [Ochrobactrum sp. P6BS-III]